MKGSAHDANEHADAAHGSPHQLRWLIFLSVLVKLWVLLQGVVLRGTPFLGHLVADVRLWSGFWERCLAGEVPGVDFGIEYPIATSVLYWAFSPLAALADGSAERMLLLHAILASLMDVVNVALLYRILREINSRLAFPLSLAFLLLPTSLILSPVRFETYVIGTVLLGYWCHIKGNWLAATFFWSVGTWLKWYPAFFIAAQQLRAQPVERRCWQWLGATCVFLGVAAVFNLPFMISGLSAHGSLDAWSFAYRFHASRGIAGDTVLGVLMIWFGELPIARFSTIWTLGFLATVLFVKPGLRIEYRCILVCISLFILNRIYSTQFNLWFYPFVILAACRESRGRRRWLLALLFLLDLVNVMVYPLLFTLSLQEIGSFKPLAAVHHGGVWTAAFSAAVALRGGLLMGLAVFILRADGQPWDTAIMTASKS